MECRKKKLNYNCFEDVCLSVCLFVCLQKRLDQKPARNAILFCRVCEIRHGFIYLPFSIEHAMDIYLDFLASLKPINEYNLGFFSLRRRRKILAAFFSTGFVFDRPSWHNVLDSGVKV